MKIRRFKAKNDEWGSDDGGVASFTFKVQSLIKGNVYDEHIEYVDAYDGHGGIKQVASGYVIDDNGCWHKIGTFEFKILFEEILE